VLEAVDIPGGMICDSIRESDAAKQPALMPLLFTAKLHLLT
jgi:hypothetical protein